MTTARRTALLLALASVPTLAGPPLFEGFDDGDAGWTAADMPCGGPYLTPLSAFPVQWAGDSGDPGPHVTAHDPSSNCYYFRAPAAFSGDLSTYAGGTLSFSVRSTLDNYDLERVVLFVGANGVTLAAPIDMPDVNAWDRRAVPLSRASFRVGHQNGAVPTQETFDAVLSSVAALYLPAEFGSIVAETVGLDSVRLRSACLADMAAPFGAVDVFDLLAFVDLFAAGDPIADVAPPEGAVDVFDLLAYLDHFAPGCP